MVIFVQLFVSREEKILSDKSVKKGGFLSHFAGRDKNLIQLSTCRPAALQAAHQDRRVSIQKTAAWTEQRYRERVGLGQNNVVANAK